MSEGVTPAAWIEDLVKFLHAQPGVRAVRVDPAGRKVAVATIGDIDLDAIGRHVSDTIAAVDARFGAGSGAAAVPQGYVLRRVGSATEVARQTCSTAESLWLWREFAWPEVEPVEAPPLPEWKPLAALAATCGGLGLAAFFGGHFYWGEEAWLTRALYLVAIVAGGWDAARDTWKTVLTFKLDIHFLMLAVAAGAMAIGAWGEATLLLFLFSASGAMEEFALDRTHREVSALLKASPKRATILGPDGGTHLVPIEQVSVGDRVLVKPGELFPADGDVVRGKTASDESTLTGEARPVEKGPGEPVFSGTLNLWGAVEVVVRRRPAESTLQKIIRLIQTAQKLKAPSERLTDKFGAPYTLLALSVTTGMFFVWWLGFRLPPFENSAEHTSAFYRAMTLLVVASPCALVLSIPSAILAAIAWGARNGILFRGGAAIEKLAEVDLVALDKTGTLTTGELSVVGCESFPSGREQEVMELACALEANSEHPIARAITQYGRKNKVRQRPVEEFESLTGRGLRGRHAGASVLLGRRELLEEGPLAGWARHLAPAPPEFTEVWILAAGVIGRVLLRDEIRLQSREVLARLRAGGIRTVMLTGDRSHAAEAVAREIGVDEVRAGLSPEDKVAAIETFRAQGRKVAMVGDGVNDAPSLAAAYVSVAMGARGSDAALEQSEVILMNDRIDNFLAAERLSRRARRIIRENLAVSLGVVVVMVLAAGAGIVPLTVGVFAHEGSTVVVCLNSLRLLVGKNR
ncbi:MAG TPA: cation-translocating P-type ATPase [Opitutaceae bacterium]|nr:cation-translocating P-type ATPase [Opitutaceae bacterium]